MEWCLSVMRSLLHYQVHILEEDANWIIFIHGAGGSIATWKHQINDLKHTFNILAIDLRDHGTSKDIQPTYPSYNFDIVVEDVKKVLDERSITRAHFVTLSFGSVLMQAIYDRHSSLVQSMVLIGGIFNANWMIKVFVHSARLLNKLLPYSYMYRVFSYLLMPKKNHQVARKVYQRQARKLAQKEYVKWLGLYSEFFYLLKSFHGQKMNTSTLIIMGEEDYLFLPSAKHFVMNHPETTLKLIQDAGHICNIEKPNEVNTVILDFLNNQIGSTRTLLTKEKSVTS